MRILGIETSCDETAVALIQASAEFGPGFSFRVLGNALISQAKLHEHYGGVFPNLAKREHQRNLVPVLMETLRQANELIEGSASTDEKGLVELASVLKREPELYDFLSQFLRSNGKPNVDCIAVTVGPGLEPALWVGINFTKALAYAWQLPIVAINHMEGHIIISALSSRNDKDNREKVKEESFEFPMLSLLISGAHTELILSREWMRYEYLGRTRDDAVGEAFDKVARLLGLPYPGGPEIARLADKAREKHLSRTIELPRPMMQTKDYDFSFAGLKTAVRKIVEAHQPLSSEMQEILALEFENTVADVLVAKTMRAIEEYGVRTVVVGGGVSANRHLRTQLATSMKEYNHDTKLFFPPPEFATDNALMIALAGYFRAQRNEYADVKTMQANGNLQLAEKP